MNIINVRFISVVLIFIANLVCLNTACAVGAIDSNMGSTLDSKAALLNSLDSKNSKTLAAQVLKA